MSRIDSNRALYESFPVEVRQAILDNRVEKGMTPEMVEMALGKPSSKETRAGRRGAMEEVWIYGGPTKSPLGGASIGIGAGPVYVGGLGSGSRGGSAEYREIVFVDGVVTGGEDAAR
jgi:hypothetical protein